MTNTFEVSEKEPVKPHSHRQIVYKTQARKPNKIGFCHKRG